MSLLILFFCEKNLRVEMGYEQIITIMKKKFFELSWARQSPPATSSTSSTGTESISK